MSKYNILIVDDSQDILNSLKRVLDGIDNVVTFKALGAQEALKILDKHNINLIISDQKMPDMSGVELFKITKSKYPDAIRILLTAFSDVEEIIDAINHGEIYRYITKPWNVIELRKVVENTLELINLKDENKTMHELIVEQNLKLKNMNINLENKVKLRTEQIKEIQHITIFALARLAESRDIETGNHLNRIRNYSSLLTEGLAKIAPYNEYITERYIENIFYSSPLHDIGKVGIPDKILLKPAKLTEDEFEIMKTHTIIGGKTLEDAEKELVKGNKKESFLSMGKNIAYYHHERWDGNGYPFKLKGENIPLSARIVAIADVYDAVTNKRVYKGAISHNDAVDMILEEKGKQFDPILIDIFKEKREKFFEISIKFTDKEY
ncbi:MAG: response regulator [Spirochaetes bacterium]|nr:response regulator [Spirochaetota bacterium]